MRIDGLSLAAMGFASKGPMQNCYEMQCEHHTFTLRSQEPGGQGPWHLYVTGPLWTVNCEHVETMEQIMARAAGRMFDAGKLCAKTEFKEWFAK